MTAGGQHRATCELKILTTNRRKLDQNRVRCDPATTDALTDHDGKAWRYESEGPALSAPRASRTWGRVVRGKILSAFHVRGAKGAHKTGFDASGIGSSRPRTDYKTGQKAC
ncbi:hypothetical protein QC762_0060990 [Podospora pseudocomata]|uniref:Uncharacterized protein n=1 Tax=Podospora pseudocomata TaxID=2093779 RepID=A0ABR0GE81_9PEZI|nr:hypothetical protein QC762_0060990 [Podospora pseudocomata]